MRFCLKTSDTTSTAWHERNMVFSVHENHQGSEKKKKNQITKLFFSGFKRIEKLRNKNGQK